MICTDLNSDGIFESSQITYKPVNKILLLKPATIISLLNLAPHPEGGWFVQTFRDEGSDACGR
jgi:hypothetical protein